MTYSVNPEIPKEYHWIIDLRLRAMAKINNDMSLSQEYWKDPYKINLVLKKKDPNWWRAIVNSVQDAIIMREIYLMGVEEGKNKSEN